MTTKIWFAAALLMTSVALPAFAADTTPAATAPATMAPTTMAPAKPHMMHKMKGKAMPMKHGAGMKASHETTTDQLNQQELSKIKS